MSARRVQISGRVQGVCFRAWTKEQARELGVTGWVRNCRDGSVEAHVQGDDQAVEALIERMRSGPAHARVDELRVEVADPESSPEFVVNH